MPKFYNSAYIFDSRKIKVPGSYINIWNLFDINDKEDYSPNGVTITGLRDGDSFRVKLETKFVKANDNYGEWVGLCSIGVPKKRYGELSKIRDSVINELNALAEGRSNGRETLREFLERLELELDGF